jgi:hypothetical protein
LEQKRNKIHNGIHSKHPRPNDSTFHGFDITRQDLSQPIKTSPPDNGLANCRRPLQNAWVDMLYLKMAGFFFCECEAREYLLL